MKIIVKEKFVEKVTFGFAAALTLWPFGIFLRRDKYLNNMVLINHESIHWKQQSEMLGIFFYIFYICEWCMKTGIYGKHAYENICFEREANDHENDLDYIKNRKLFAWLKYL
jgi:hypothetical protein